MKWDNNIFKEDNMLISERNGETTDDTCEDIEEFSCTVEFVVLVNQGIEAFIH
jgi:hypothetical protein